MAHYFVAQIKINDPAGYQKYLDQCDGIFSRFRGEYLAVDQSPSLLEGEWDYSRSVIIKFNTRQDFEDWYYSDDYQKILKHRLNAAKCDTILLTGTDQEL